MPADVCYVLVWWARPRTGPTIANWSDDLGADHTMVSAGQQDPTQICAQTSTGAAETDYDIRWGNPPVRIWARSATRLDHDHVLLGSAGLLPMCWWSFA